MRSLAHPCTAATAARPPALGGAGMTYDSGSAHTGKPKPVSRHWSCTPEASGSMGDAPLSQHFLAPWMTQKSEFETHQLRMESTRPLVGRRLVVDAAPASKQASQTERRRWLWDIHSGSWQVYGAPGTSPLPQYSFCDAQQSEAGSQTAPDALHLQRNGVSGAGHVDAGRTAAHLICQAAVPAVQQAGVQAPPGQAGRYGRPE